MKNLKILSVVLAATMASLPAAAETVWEMPTPYPEAEFHTQNVKKFTADVERLTKGELKINVHSAQSLFKHPDIKRAVQTNQVAIGEMLMANLFNENPIFGADVVPFLATSHAEALRLWDAQRPIAEKQLAAKGMRLLYAIPWPGQGFYTKTKIERVDDLRGVKFRTYNAATARLAELMGAEPTIVEVVEIPQAFSTGVVEAMVTSSATGVRAKAWDFVKYFYDLNAWLPKNMIFVNERAFGQLDKSAQKAVLEAARIAEDRGWQMSEEVAGSSVRALINSGMAIEPGSDELRTQLKKIGAQMSSEWVSKAGDDGRQLLSKYNK